MLWVNNYFLVIQEGNALMLKSMKSVQEKNTVFDTVLYVLEWRDTVCNTNKIKPPVSSRLKESMYKKIGNFIFVSLHFLENFHGSYAEETEKCFL